MEPWQRNHIRANLPQLLIDTVVDASLIAKLIADGVLGDGDMDCLKAILDRSEQVSKFYDILQKRSKSYNFLKQALMETKQSGAYDILNTCNEENNLTPFKNCGTISYGKELLGRGCHGTRVVKGKFENGDVAVKKINRYNIKVPLALREVAIMIGLDWHENVIRYFRTEITDGSVLIAMELCDTNLHDWVMKPKTVEIGALEVLRQTTQGVAHLHGNKIVHRDLKPANILVVRHSIGVVRVKIADFGMSRNIPDGQSMLTVHTSGLGTEGWMAPEVLECLLNESCSEYVLRMGLASDIFSLGCIFYFVLTDGIHPFGNPFRRQGNILDGKFELIENQITEPKIGVSSFLELVKEMISHDGKDRPLVTDVLPTLSGISNGRHSDIEEDCIPESSSDVSHNSSSLPNFDGHDDLLTLQSGSNAIVLYNYPLEAFVVPSSSMASDESSMSRNWRDSFSTPAQLSFDNATLDMNINYDEPISLRKRRYRVGLSLFNKKPENGISYLVNNGFVAGNPSAIAKLLIQQKGISKHVIGQYLANPSSKAILESFSKEVNLDSMTIDEAIRKFQNLMELRADPKGIDRLLESFTRRYLACNPNFMYMSNCCATMLSKFCKGKDTVYVLAYAILMLNSDLHTPGLKKERKMTAEDFIRSLDGVESLDRGMLTEIYERIRQAELKRDPDHVSQVLRVQQSIVGRELDLALPYRRLISSYPFEGQGMNMWEFAASFPLEAFLFSDLLVITEHLNTKTTPVKYSFLQEVTLTGATLSIECTDPYSERITLRKGENVLEGLAYYDEIDGTGFANDLEEAIAESNELDRVERLLEVAAKSDSGVNVGKLKRLSLADIRDEPDCSDPLTKDGTDDSYLYSYNKKA